MDAEMRRAGSGGGGLPAHRRRVGVPAVAVDDPVRAGRSQHRMPTLPRDAPLPPRHAPARVRLRPLRHAGLSHRGDVHAGSGLSVATWFAGAWQLMEGDASVAPRALADELGVSYKTALRVKRKLEEAMAPGSPDADLLERLRRDAGGPGALTAGVPARDRSSRARENIRAAACRAFAARGPSATRIADIAARPASRARSSTTTTSPRTRCCWRPSSGPTSRPPAAGELRQQTNDP